LLPPAYWTRVVLKPSDVTGVGNKPNERCWTRTLASDLQTAIDGSDESLRLEPRYRCDIRLARLGLLDAWGPDIADCDKKLKARGLP
jgi:hypothetical protein